jgi:hypothetical protein
MDADFPIFVGDPAGERNRKILILIPNRRLIDHKDWSKTDELLEYYWSDFGGEPSWDDVRDAEWRALGDTEEVAVRLLIAPVESLTEQQYRGFSEVVLPSKDGFYDRFLGAEIPLLTSIKDVFTNHAAIAHFVRPKEQEAKNSQVRLTL